MRCDLQTDRNWMPIAVSIPALDPVCTSSAGPIADGFANKTPSERGRVVSHARLGFSDSGAFGRQPARGGQRRVSLGLQDQKRRPRHNGRGKRYLPVIGCALDCIKGSAVVGTFHPPTGRSFAVS